MKYGSLILACAGLVLAACSESGDLPTEPELGAEGDERFDWTRFYVLSLENKDQCRDGDWEALGFKNQGQCVRFVETGKDSRTGG